MCRIEGFSYHEVVSIYALMTAGYIPQCIPTRLPNIDIVYELASSSGAKALLYHSSIMPPAHSPMYTREVRQLCPSDFGSVPEYDRPIINPDDVIVIYHTSGSTGKLPKLVRFTGRRLAVISKIHTRIFKTPQTRNWL